MPAKDKNKLGLWTSTSLVIGNMIGAGVFLMPATLAMYGAISLVGWLVAAAGALLLAMVFSNLSKLFPNENGGIYAFTRAGFGDFAGFIVAWGYWISVWCTNAAIAVSFVGALSLFFPILASNATVAVLTGLSAIWFLTWINTRGVVASGKLQLVTTALKLLPLVMIAVCGVFYINYSNFTPFNISSSSNLSAVTATATLALFAFLGVECATIPATNVDQPEKTIPRATMIGTIVTSLVYIFSTMCVLGIVPAKILQHSVTPFADAATVIWGGNARYWVGAGVAIAGFGALNGWILVQGQIPAAIAKHKLFPALFEKENSKGVPALGIIVSSVLVSVLMTMNFTKGLVEQFRSMILLSTFTSVVPYLLSMAAYAIVMIKKEQQASKPLIKALILSTLAFAFALWAIIGAGQETVYQGMIALCCGIPLFVWMIWKNKNSA